MKTALYLLCIVACVSTSGCVLAPGTSARTPRVSGRVLSATTRKPVAGAVVALHDAPKLRSTTTDSLGRFSLSESRNFHLFVLIGHGGPMDILSSLGDDIDISHPAFRTQRFNPWNRAARKSATPYFVEVRDIFLHARTAGDRSDRQREETENAAIATPAEAR